MYLFAPQATTTQALTTSASTAKLLAGQPKSGAFQVRVYNDGTTLAYIAFGTSSVAAAVTDIPIPPGIPCGFTISNPAKGGAVYFSGIMASSTATMTVTTGDGI